MKNETISTTDKTIREMFNSFLDLAYIDYQDRAYGERKVYGAVSSAFSNMKKGVYPRVETSAKILKQLGYEVEVKLIAPK